MWFEKSHCALQVLQARESQSISHALLMARHRRNGNGDPIVFVFGNLRQNIDI